MNVREAKDFLVQQITEQASLEGIPLSDLEKRMMYFTEGKSAVEDPIALNEEFEGQNDTPKYEKKISHLMHHAYRRLRKDGGGSVRTWDDAIRRLKRGDHYILVMSGGGNGVSATLWILALAVAGAALLFGVRWFTTSFTPPNPRILFAIFIGIAVLGIFFPKFARKFVDFVFENTIERFMRGKEEDDG